MLLCAVFLLCWILREICFTLLCCISKLCQRSTERSSPSHVSQAGLGPPMLGIVPRWHQFQHRWVHSPHRQGCSGCSIAKSAVKNKFSKVPPQKSPSLLTCPNLSSGLCAFPCRGWFCHWAASSTAAGETLSHELGSLQAQGLSFHLGEKQGLFDHLVFSDLTWMGFMGLGSGIFLMQTCGSTEWRENKGQALMVCFNVWDSHGCFVKFWDFGRTWLVAEGTQLWLQLIRSQ